MLAVQCPCWLSQLFINNKWVDAKQGGKLDVVDPRTGDTIKQIASAGGWVGGALVGLLNNPAESALH